jgi:hypothetical protein
MTRRRRTAPGMDSFEDLVRKVKVLEREMALQRKALDRLKQMGSERRVAAMRAAVPARKTA